MPENSVFLLRSTFLGNLRLSIDVLICVLYGWVSKPGIFLMFLHTIVIRWDGFFIHEWLLSKERCIPSLRGRKRSHRQTNKKLNVNSNKKIIIIKASHLESRSESTTSYCCLLFMDRLSLIRTSKYVFGKIKKTMPIILLQNR